MPSATQDEVHRLYCRDFTSSHHNDMTDHSLSIGERGLPFMDTDGIFCRQNLNLEPLAIHNNASSFAINGAENSYKSN